MKHKMLYTLLALVLLASMILAACAPTTPATTEAPPEPVVTEAPPEPVMTEAPTEEPVVTEEPVMTEEASQGPVTFIFGRGADSVQLDPAIVTDGESFRVTGQVLEP